MAPTYRHGDRLLVVWGSGRLRVGDAVVLRRPGLLTVKRLTALSADGRSVEVRGDNPLASTDSRTYGAVARTDVAGRVLLRFPATRRPASGSIST